jgi:hypothetical protein
LLAMLAATSNSGDDLNGFSSLGFLEEEES